MWTPANLTLVRDRWAGGYTAGQIAAELGVTRSAVMGVISRHHYQQPPKTKPRPQPLLPKPANGRIPPAPPPPTPAAERLTIWQLEEHHCRWPDGEQAPFRYCGQNKISGSSYCAMHHRRAHSS